MSELAMITGDQIRQARKLLGWHRGQIAIRARGITGNTVGKAEGAYPGKPPTPEQLAEIRAVLEALSSREPSGRDIRPGGAAWLNCTRCLGVFGQE